MPKTLAVIPARYASSRFPGKPLVKIAGRSMILRVCDQLQKASEIDDFLVATDDQRIYNEVKEAGFEAIMTSPSHQSGTDRIVEIASQRDDEWILNVQGDEPFLEPDTLDNFLLEFHQKASNCLVGTLACPIHSLQELSDSNVVKVVLRHDRRALYFSRAPIPQDRDNAENLKYCFRHLGVYLYAREVLLNFSKLPESDLEKLEKLEQLRLLQAGYDLYVHLVSKGSLGIDTPEDLQKAEKLFNGIS